MIGRAFLAALLLAGLVAGCESPPPQAFVGTAGRGAEAAAVPVGTNEVGEPCRFQPVSSSLGQGRDAVIFCGDWEQPSGRVSELAPVAGPAQLDALAVSGAWRASIDQRFTCGAPVRTSILAGSPAVLMECTRRVGGWPHLAIATVVDGRVYAADAVRSALPALERTVAALAGHGGAPDTASGPSEARRLIAQRSGGVRFGSGDLARFFEQVRLGDAYNNIGDPTAAERAYREALAIQQRILGPDNPGLALTMMKLGAQLAHQGDRREAERMLASAAALTARQPDPLLVAQLDFYRATTAAYNGNPEEATRFVRRAETEFARLAPRALARTSPGPGAGGGAVRGGLALGRGQIERLVGEDVVASGEERAATLGLAETMRLHATLLQLSGQLHEAQALARRAERLLDQTGLSYSSTAARSLRLLASNQAVGGDYPLAVGTSGEAASIFERITPTDRPAALNLLSRGYYLLASNRIDAALDSFRKAGAILRSPTVNGGVTAEAILPWLDALERAPGGAAQNAAEMFEAAQLARSGQTAQDIARATAALTAESPQAAEAVRGFEQRKERVDRLERERIAAEQNKAPADVVAALDRQLEEAAQAQREAEAAILAAAPRYAQAAEKPVSAANFQRLLAPDEALAFLFIADRGGYGFLVRPGAITAYKIPLSAAQITELVARLRDTTVAQPGGLPVPDFAASYRLYSALFGPVEPQFAGVRKITVSATGDLLRYPLEALVTEPGVSDNNGDYRQVPFLVRRVALSYVPAPRILANVRGSRTASGPRPFIGFGDFRPPSAGQLLASFPPDRCGDDYRRLQGLQPLPATRAEVVAIGQQLGAGPGEVVFGDEFTEQRLARSDLSQYRNILLATHAFFPAGTLRCMNDPAIALSPPPRAPNADAAFLHPRDIERLKINADLVALSACNTSGAQGGESLAGLARSFFLAGSRGLLLTHWEIVTGAAVPLMIGTFGAGGGTTNSAQALQAAKLRLIESAGSTAALPIELSHPNYWAAFVLFGDGVRAVPGT
jgi:CHAT domain-containing protein/tetratricopeptide (TPR) repeat protein